MTLFYTKNKKIGNLNRVILNGGDLHQHTLGTQVNRCGCSLPGLTRFTAYCCEGTNGGHHNGRELWGMYFVRSRVLSSFSMIYSDLYSTKKLEPIGTASNGFRSGCSSIKVANSFLGASICSAVSWIVFQCIPME